MADHAFPAPVGGTPLPNVDFAPSLLFAILYALLIPLMIYRMVHRRSRTFLLIGTITFAIERVVIFSLRAVQSRRESERVSTSLATYMQISFALGFLSRGSDLVSLLRCLLVNPTFGLGTYVQSPASNTKVGQTTFDVPAPDAPDRPRFRFWARRFCDLLGLMFLIPIATGIVAHSQYGHIIDNLSQAQKTRRFRIVSSVSSFAMFTAVLLATLWAQPRTSSGRSIVILLVLCLPMIVVSIYRLCITRATAMSFDGPSSLDTTSAKALFYIFHMLPEFLFSALVLGVNIRETFGTGFWGDWRGTDENDQMRRKREAREKKKAEKRAAQGGEWQELSNKPNTSRAV